MSKGDPDHNIPSKIGRLMTPGIPEMKVFTRYLTCGADNRVKCQIHVYTGVLKIKGIVTDCAKSKLAGIRHYHIECGLFFPLGILLSSGNRPVTHYSSDL